MSEVGRPRLAVWATAAVLIVAMAAAPARAQEATSTYRAVLDRADLEPASVGGYRLRVYVSALSLDGQILDLTEPKSLKMTASRTEIRAPYALGTFAAAQTDLALVFVLQATAEYGEVLRVITEAADSDFFGGLPDRTLAGLVTYGETVGTGKLGALKSARTKLTQITPEGAVAEPALLDALDRALRLLKGAKTDPPGRPLRKMIVVVSDGRDRSNDRDRVTALGKRAAAAGVRIHTLAHAPMDVRRPLLLLGELSKRSFGTFRWLRKDSTTLAPWQQRFHQLLDEVKQQYVITYFVDDDLAGRELKLSSSGRTVLTSLNELKVPQAGCNGETCEEGAYCADTCMKPRKAEGRGVMGWIFMIVGIGIGAIFVLGVVGYVLTKRQQAKAAGAGAVPGVPGVAGVPGSLPPGIPGTGAYPPGARMPSQPPGVATGGYPSAPPQPAVAPTSGPRLYIMAGPRAGETLALRHGFLIGAAPHNDLVIADGFASSQHAQIGMDAQGNCWLADLGSTNGTFVNGVRVTQKTLDHGVSLKIGSTEIRFLAQ
jgi:hypothetical protein